MSLVYGSVCSGMEAASLAWHPLGWRCAFVSEIDKAPSALLAQRYPDVPNFGDMTKFEDWPDVAIDLLAGGTPCQSFSVAGLRKGVADPRGSLMLTYGAIAKRYRPTWLFWENVPGVLSSNGGRDFGAFLGMLAELGYGFAYRVLDAQFFGLAQRRKRVFVVGYLGDWRPPAAVLFERESLRGDSPPRRQAGKRIARPIASCPAGGSGYRNDADTADNLIASKDYTQGAAADTLISSACVASNGGVSGKDGIEGRVVVTTSGLDDGQVARALNGCETAAGRYDVSVDTFVVEERAPFAFKSAHFTRGKDGAPSDIAPALSADADKGDQDTLVMAFAPIAFGSKEHAQDAGDVSPPLRAMGHDESHQNGGGQVAIAYQTSGNCGAWETGDMTGALDTNTDNTSHVITLAIRGRGDGHDLEHRQDGTANAVLTPNGGRCGIGVGAVAFDTTQITSKTNRSQPEAGKPCHPVTAEGHAPAVAYIAETYAVRRLTPLECERLQGAPDDWTNIAYRGKNTIADGPRYKMIGNSWAVPCVRWIGNRIAEVHTHLKPEPAEQISKGE